MTVIKAITMGNTTDVMNSSSLACRTLRTFLSAGYSPLDGSVHGIENPLEARDVNHGLRLFTGTVEAGDNLHAPAAVRAAFYKNGATHWAEQLVWNENQTSIHYLMLSKRR